MIAIPSITVHGFGFTGVDGWVLTMPDVLIERLVAHAPDLSPHLDKPHIVDAEGQDIEALFSRIADEFTDIRPGRLLSIQACLELILVWLARRLLVEREREVAVQSKAAAHARRFRQLVEMGFREQRALDRYAQELGMTTTQLNRVCRAVFGKSALGVIHDRLLLEATTQPRLHLDDRGRGRIRPGLLRSLVFHPVFRPRDGDRTVRVPPHPA